jgi:hypothetical protein
LQYVEILIMYESNPTVHHSPPKDLSICPCGGELKSFAENVGEGGREIGICFPENKKSKNLNRDRIQSSLVLGRMVASRLPCLPPLKYWLLPQK